MDSGLNFYVFYTNLLFSNKKTKISTFIWNHDEVSFLHSQSVLYPWYGESHGLLFSWPSPGLKSAIWGALIYFTGQTYSIFSQKVWHSLHKETATKLSKRYWKVKCKDCDASDLWLSRASLVPWKDTLGVRWG